MTKINLLVTTITLTYSSVFSLAQVGIKTDTPQETLHVNGTFQLTNELNVGGTANTQGDAGDNGEVLTSSGPNSAPTWKTLSLGSTSNIVSDFRYVQGTDALTINEGQTANVPGVVFAYTVPAGKTQTLLFTVTGYAAVTTDSGAQGVFILRKDGVKITSAFASSANYSGTSGLIKLPIPATLVKTIKLTAGTYFFDVLYKAWRQPQTVNLDPSIYIGYDGDKECMLTKMQVLIYNEPS